MSIFVSVELVLCEEEMSTEQKVIGKGLHCGLDTMTSMFGSTLWVGSGWALSRVETINAVPRQT